MQRWTIVYDDEKALNEILKIGEVAFKHSSGVNYIDMYSCLNKKEIMNIKGVKECIQCVFKTIYI